MVLERPGRVTFSYPSCFKQDGDYVQVSDASDLSLLVSFDSESGRFYSGALLQCQANFPHKYSRTVQEVSVTVPSNIKAPKAEEDSGLTANPSMFGDATASMQKSMSASRVSQKQKSMSLSLEQFIPEAETSQEQSWNYCLLYGVKEGILVFFADDLESCEEVVRSVAARFRDVLGKPSKPGQSLPPDMPLDDHPQIQCTRLHIGRTSPTCGRILAELLQNELKREFQINATLETQNRYTNCAVMCVRIMMANQLSMRGFDIEKACQAIPSIGPKAGKAAGEAWEKLWRQVRA